MAAVIRELRDPLGIGFALLTLAANLAFRVNPAAAIGAALLVLAVRVIAGMIWPARSQQTAAQPPPPASPLPEQVRATAGPGPLSRREWEVAQLVAQGLSNREIGRRLFIEERTVDNHIQHIFNKLDMHARTQIAAWVVARTPRTDEPRK